MIAVGKGGKAERRVEEATNCGSRGRSSTWEERSRSRSLTRPKRGLGAAEVARTRWVPSSSTPYSPVNIIIRHKACSRTH